MTDTLFDSTWTDHTPDAPRLALTRLHMRSVGPKGARLDPLDMDLTAGGATAARVLWNLTNTGGKTTLIRLLTSAIVPAANAAMGGANIGEYVGNGDTSHVLLEWDDASIGRYVTGAVYEWPDRTPPAGTPISKLKRSWYLFRSERLRVDDLPFVRDNRRQAMRNYMADLGELFRSAPAAEGVVTDSQATWAAALEQRTSIDPTLFTYQMRMNDDEAGAGALVKRMNNSDAVVRFFVEALLDDTSWNDFTGLLAAYAEHAGARQRLEAERGFYEAIAGPLTGLTAAQGRLDEAVEADGLAKMLADETATLIARRLAADTTRAERLKVEHAADLAERDRLATALNVGDARRSQLVLEDARFELQERQADFGAAADRLSDAEAETKAWRATEQIASWRAADAAARADRDAAHRAQEGLRVFRDAKDQSGAALAAKYAALAGRSDADAAAAEADTARIDTRREEITAARRVHDRAVAEATAALEQIRSRGVEAARTLAEAVKAGHANTGETAADALRRWEAALADARVRLDDLQAQRRRAERRQRDLAGERRQQEAARHRDELARSEAASRVSAHNGDLAALGRDEVIADILVGGAVEDADPGQLAAAVGDRAAAAEQALEAVATTAQEVARELAPLTRGDLAATIADVERLVTVLLDAGIGATTGWAWLAGHTDPQARQALIEAAPALADGVVVTDPARLGDARTVLADVGESLPLAVWVSTVTGLEDLGGPGPANPGFVVGPRRALYEPEWAARRRSELEAEASCLDAERVALSSARDAARAAAGALEAFTRRWSDGVDADRERIAVLDLALAGHREALEGLDDEAEQLSETIEAIDADVRAVSGERDRADGHSRSLRIPATVEADAGRLADTADTETGRRRVAEEALTALGREDRALGAERAERAGRAHAARLDAGHYRERQSEVGIEASGDEPAADLGVLAAEFAAARAALESAAAGAGTEKLEAKAEASAARAAELGLAVSGLEREVRDAAEQLLVRLEAATATGRAEALASAEVAERRAREDHAEARAARTAAENRVQGALTPEGRNHTALPPEWVPRDRAHAAELLEQVNAANRDIRDEQRKVAERIAAGGQTIAGLDGDITRFGAALAIHSAGEESAVGMWQRGSDAALEETNARRQAVTEAAERLSAAKEQRAGAAQRVRKVAGDAPWAEVTSAVKERCRADLDDVLGPEAEDMAHVVAQNQATIEADLAALGTHRDLLVTHLGQMCSSQRRLLGQVSKASTLPPGLRSLSGRPTFRIDFDPLPEPEARAALSHRVDEWADTLAGGRRLGRDDRVSMLCTAVADTLHRPAGGGRPWRVKVLKPEISGTVSYKDPERITVEYSGGQELTLAVMLYCALAAVRAGRAAAGNGRRGLWCWTTRSVPRRTPR